MWSRKITIRTQDTFEELECYNGVHKRRQSYLVSGFELLSDSGVIVGNLSMFKSIFWFFYWTGKYLNQAWNFGKVYVV